MVRDLAYFNTKFVTGYVITQSDYVDLGDTYTNLKVILAASNEVEDNTLIKNVSYGARMQFGTDTFTFWGLININSLSNAGEKPVLVDNSGVLKVNPVNQYRALLSQSGSDDPTIVSTDASNNPNPFINNYIDPIVWTRFDDGFGDISIKGTLPGAFQVGKFSGYIITKAGTYQLSRIDDDTIQSSIIGDDQLDFSGVFLETYP